MSTVTITDAPLSIEELLAVVDGAPVDLAPAAQERAGHAVGDRRRTGGGAWLLGGRQRWRRHRR